VLVVTMIGLMHILVTWLKHRCVMFREFIDGTPVVLWQNGKWRDDLMYEARLQVEDVIHARWSGSAPSEAT
jgi:uncharacterized membrane protein YcaP (DUF421 family)